MLILLMVFMHSSTSAATATPSSENTKHRFLTHESASSQYDHEIMTTPQLAWLIDQVTGNLDLLKTRVASGNTSTWNPRDLPNGAMASLLIQTKPGSAVHTCDPATAMFLLQKFGDRTDTSFGGQGWPFVWFGFAHCFNATQRDWLFDVFNRSVVASQAAATTQDYSYTNMWLMSTVNSILFGEIVGGPRGELCASIGYTMFETFYNYTRSSGIHEFTSPTYTHVQLTALYAGYIHAKKPGAREQFGKVLDLIWADAAANFFEAAGSLSGPHSRDYDTLLGRGMFYVELYLHGLPGSAPLKCEFLDPHCEGPTDGAIHGTGEPMTVLAIDLYNFLHPKGYRPSQDIIKLASRGPERIVQNRFIGQSLTANGESSSFGDTYNFIRQGVYAIGSASQDYITRTHDKYFPNPQDKLINVIIGGMARSNQSHHRPAPQITIQPDWMDLPYGIWDQYPKPFNSLGRCSHLALHPGNVQSRNILLTTVSLNARDQLDGFQLTPAGNEYSSLATNILLPVSVDRIVLVFPNATLYIREKPVSSIFSVPLPVGTTLGIQIGSSAFAAKVFYVDGAGGQKPHILWKADTLGLELGVMRLAAYHYQSSAPMNLTSLSDSHINFAALLVVDEVLPKANLSDFVIRVSQAVTSANVDLQGNILTVKANYETHSLEVKRNLTCSESNGVFNNQSIHTRWNCLLSRRVNGSMIIPGPLRVDGEVFAPL